MPEEVLLRKFKLILAVMCRINKFDGENSTEPPTQKIMVVSDILRLVPLLGENALNSTILLLG